MNNTCLAINNPGEITHPRDTFMFKLFSEELKLVPYECGGDMDDNYFNPDNPPKLIILYHSSAYREWLLWKKIKALWGDQTFIVSSTSESYDVFHDLSNFALSYRQYNKNQDLINTVWISNSPYVEAMINLRGHHPKKLDEFIATCDLNMTNMEALDAKIAVKRWQKIPKDKFCSFVNKNRNLKYPGVWKRNKLASLLSRYKTLGCGGRMMNNTQDLRELEKLIKGILLKLNSYLAISSMWLLKIVRALSTSLKKSYNLY